MDEKGNLRHLIDEYKLRLRAEASNLKGLELCESPMFELIVDPIQPRLF